MKVGDGFRFLHDESDHRFGEECKVLAVRGDKLDFRFVAHPNWRTVTMPIEWARPKKDYTEDEINEIRLRWRRKRWRSWYL